MTDTTGRIVVATPADIQALSWSDYQLWLGGRHVVNAPKDHPGGYRSINEAVAPKPDMRIGKLRAWFTATLRNDLDPEVVEGVAGQPVRR